MAQSTVLHVLYAAFAELYRILACQSALHDDFAVGVWDSHPASIRGEVTQGSSENATSCFQQCTMGRLPCTTGNQTRACSDALISILFFGSNRADGLATVDGENSTCPHHFRCDGMVCLF